MIGWFEIPVVDMERAMKFYGGLFGCEFSDMEVPYGKMKMFPMEMEKPGAPGALIQSDQMKPSTDGVTVYFTSPTADLNADHKKVEELGGKVTVPRTDIGHGFVLMCEDVEGNRFALHSMK